MQREELKILLALGLLPKIGPVRAREILAHFGGVKQVFENPKELIQIIPGKNKIKAADISDAIQKADTEMEWAEKNNVQIISYLNDAYPYRLRNLHDHPLLLYYKGNAALNNRKVVGIIGTRTATKYGEAAVQEIVKTIAPYKPLVLSGLAYGIDKMAHQAALDNDLETVGVLGHGLHTIYPPLHRKLADKMLLKGGLLTEYTTFNEIVPANYPQRNRIVAGMLDALIVVETKKKGGSMITAEIAFSNNRDVYAVPGNIAQENSQGCNFLIRLLKAQILDDIAEFPKMIGWGDANDLKQNIQFELPLDLSESENKILKLLQSEKQLSIDQLSIKSKMPNSKLAAMLLELEFKGLVSQYPGKQYQLS